MVRFCLHRLLFLLPFSVCVLFRFQWYATERVAAKHHRMSLTLFNPPVKTTHYNAVHSKTQIILERRNIWLPRLSKL